MVECMNRIRHVGQNFAINSLTIIPRFYYAHKVMQDFVPNNSVLYYNINGTLALKPHYLGPWTLIQFPYIPIHPL